MSELDVRVIRYVFCPFRGTFLRHLFPSVRTQRACNRRLRRLWGAFILIQDAMAVQLAQGAYELPAKFPLLFSGTHTVHLKAGIMLNGIGERDASPS